MPISDSFVQLFTTASRSARKAELTVRRPSIGLKMSLMSTLLMIGLSVSAAAFSGFTISWGNYRQ